MVFLDKMVKLRSQIHSLARIHEGVTLPYCFSWCFVKKKKKKRKKHKNKQISFFFLSTSMEKQCLSEQSATSSQVNIHLWMVIFLCGMSFQCSPLLSSVVLNTRKRYQLRTFAGHRWVTRRVQTRGILSEICWETCRDCRICPRPFRLYRHPTPTAYQTDLCSGWTKQKILV